MSAVQRVFHCKDLIRSIAKFIHPYWVNPFFKSPEGAILEGRSDLLADPAYQFRSTEEVELFLCYYITMIHSDVGKVPPVHIARLIRQFSSPGATLTLSRETIAKVNQTNPLPYKWMRIFKYGFQPSDWGYNEYQSLTGIPRQSDETPNVYTMILSRLVYDLMVRSQDFGCTNDVQETRLLLDKWIILTRTEILISDFPDRQLKVLSFHSYRSPYYTGLYPPMMVAIREIPGTFGVLRYITTP